MATSLERFKKISCALAIVCMASINTTTLRAMEDEAAPPAASEETTLATEQPEAESTENKGATVVKVDGEKADVTNGGSKKDSGEVETPEDSEAPEVAPEKDGGGILEKVSKGMGAACTAVTGAVVTSKNKVVDFHKANDFVKSAHEKIGCPYKDHPVLFGAVVGAITGIALYRVINNRINKRALVNLSDDEKQDIALAGLLSQRNEFQKASTDIETAVEKRGFATITEEEELVRLKTELAQTEGYIIAVIRAKKTVAQLVTDFLSFDVIA